MQISDDPMIPKMMSQGSTLIAKTKPNSNGVTGEAPVNQNDPKVK